MISKTPLHILNKLIFETKKKKEVIRIDGITDKFYLNKVTHFTYSFRWTGYCGV